MLSLPSAASSLFMSFSVAFTEPTFRRVIPLAAGAILTLGHRTITAVLRTLRGLAPGHPTYLSPRLLPGLVVVVAAGQSPGRGHPRADPAGEPVLVPMDDTTAQHRGKCVYGKGCHHDAVRSAHKHVVFRWGHRWIVLAISVKFPFTCAAVGLARLGRFVSSRAA